MKPLFKKLFAVVLSVSLLCLVLTGCNKDDDADNPDLGVTPPASSDTGDTGVNPPDNLGSPDGDVNFGLQGPGDTQFEDVDYNGSQPGVSGVGEPVDGNQYTYNPPDTDLAPVDDESPTDVGPNLINDENPEDGLGGTPDEQEVPVEVPPETPPVNEEPPVEVPPEVALPNTGMFLEDD